MHPNAALIDRFYKAFQARDGAAMTACYHPEARFSDPVFLDLRGPEVGGMWRMLYGRAKDLVIEFRDVDADDARGKAHWDATYTFTATGRKVLNRIDARFEFKDGLIHRHEDAFDFARWSRQALGIAGLLLGRTRFLQRKVQAQAADGLREFLAKECG